MKVFLSAEPLSVDAVRAEVAHAGAGAVALFLGLVRDENEGRDVTLLEYSAYEPMALSEMRRIAEAIEAERPGVRVAVAHRTGELGVGDLAVVCAASSKHRPDAFWACREAIDRIKADVPIWKREHGPDGTAWVGWVDARCAPGGHGDHAHAHHAHGHHAHAHHAHAQDAHGHASASGTGLRVATVTVSDTRHEGNDRSGAALRAGLGAFSLTPHRLVSDDPDRIREALGLLVDEGHDAVVLTGGTGIAPRDVTVETLTAFVDRPLDGFGEAFRRLSWDAIGPRALLSRATAGVRGKTLIFAVPGSPRAAALGARLVCDLLPHAHEVLAGQPHAEVP